MLDSHRVLYNEALQERRDAYRMAGVTLRYGDQPGRVKDIRRSHPDQARRSFSPQQATLARLNRAFEAFFRRVKPGAKPGLPRFERAGWFYTVNAALNILWARLARHTAQAA
jgi:putative transposase